jgi:hypothetical protein
MTWNSLPSRIFDVLFGVFPALFFGFWAAFGCYATATFFAQQLNNDRLGTILLFLISLIGLFACLSLIYVSLARENTRSKMLIIGLLALGIAASIILFIFPSPLGYIDSLKIVFPFFAISLVLVAAKQIYLLSRVTQKVSL